MNNTKKDLFSKFNNEIAKLDTTHNIFGGEDPGITTDTSKCTWKYDQNGTYGDTDKDGDWYDTCSSEPSLTT